MKAQFRELQTLEQHSKCQLIYVEAFLLRHLVENDALNKYLIAAGYPENTEVVNIHGYEYPGDQKAEVVIYHDSFRKNGGVNDRIKWCNEALYG